MEEGLYAKSGRTEATTHVEGSHNRYTPLDAVEGGHLYRLYDTNRVLQKYSVVAASDQVHHVVCFL